MLELKHHTHLDFSHMTFHVPHSMHLSPVTIDNDELSQAIENDPETLDNDWTLEERPDGEALTHYWDEILADDAMDRIDFAQE